MLSEIPIQKRKVSMSIEKLQVHFGKGKGNNQGNFCFNHTIVCLLKERKYFKSL